MPDVRGATSPSRSNAIIPPWRRPAVTAFRQFKAERTADGVGLREAQGQPLPNAIGLAGLVANQLASRFVIAEIFLAQRLREHQTVAAQILHGGEEAERLDAGDPAFNQLPHLVGEIGGDV